MKLPKLLKNPPKTAIAVLAFLILAFSYRACQASDGFLELGPTFTSGFNGSAGLMYTERFDDRIDLGLMLIGEQDYRGTTYGNNGGVSVSFVMHRPADVWRYLPDEALLGASAWIHTDERLIGCMLGFNLGLRWNLGDRFHIGWRHWSNAGTCKPNNGQDLLVLGMRF